MDAKYMADLEAMQKQNQLEMAKAMKDMGMDPNELNQGTTYDDPELAELDRELKRREGGIVEIDDEAAMLAELDKELGIETDPFKRVEELKAQVAEQLKLASRAKGANDTQKALGHLQEKKRINAELEEYLLYHPEAAQPKPAPKVVEQQQQPLAAAAQQPAQRANQTAALAQQISGAGMDAMDPIELEEKYTDPNLINSMAVIEWELKYHAMLMEKFKNSPDDHDFYEMRVDSLKFTKDSIEGNIAAGVTSPESYTADLQKFLAESKRNHQEAVKNLGPSHEQTQRLNKRVRLVEGEIAEITGEGEEQEPAQAAPAQQQVAQLRQSEEVKQVQLSDKHLRILGILQSRKREFEDAAQYTLTTLKNRPQAGELITKLDSIGQLVTKVLSGNLPTAEEIKEVKPISGELILGYNEKTRIAKFNEVYIELQKQIREKTATAQKYKDTMRKMTRKQDKDATTQVVLSIVEEVEELKRQSDNLKVIVKNPFQPPPEFEEVKAMVNQEKTNAELEPNEFQIKFKGNPQLEGTGASYIKYQIDYEDGKLIEGHFDIKKQEDTLKHKFESANLTKMLWGLKEKQIIFKLKKKKGIFGFRNEEMETQSLNLTLFGANSMLEKHFTMQGHRVGIEMMLHKATRVKEYEKVEGTKLGLSPVLPPFKTLEEIAAAKAGTAVAQQQQPAQAAQARPKGPAPQQVAQQPRPTPQATAAGQQSQDQRQAQAAGTVSLPAGCTANDVKDPDNVDNLVCMSILVKKAEDFEANTQAALKAGKRDQMKAWQAKWLATGQKKNTIENACNSGEMSEQDYIDIVQRQLNKDHGLLAYFKQVGAVQKAEIVSERISIQRQELAEVQQQ